MDEPVDIVLCDCLSYTLSTFDMNILQVKVPENLSMGMNQWFWDSKRTL